MKQGWGRLCGSTHDLCMKRRMGKRGVGLCVDYVAQLQTQTAAEEKAGNAVGKESKEQEKHIRI